MTHGRRWSNARTMSISAEFAGDSSAAVAAASPPRDNLSVREDELVYPNPSDNRAAIDRHLKDYGYPSIGAADPNHALVKTAQATITPEAAVFDKDRRLIYRGRIDDRFVELGRERPAATAHDLRNALAAALAGRAVTPSRTQAVGCFIADMVRPSAIVHRRSSIGDRVRKSDLAR